MANPAQTLPQFVAQFKSQIAAYAAKFEGGKMPAVEILSLKIPSISELAEIVDILGLDQSYMAHIKDGSIILYNDSAYRVLERIGDRKISEHEDGSLDYPEIVRILVRCLDGSIFDPENID